MIKNILLDMKRSRQSSRSSKSSRSSSSISSKRYRSDEESIVCSLFGSVTESSFNITPHQSKYGLRSVKDDDASSRSSKRSRSDEESVISSLFGSMTESSFEVTPHRSKYGLRSVKENKTERITAVRPCQLPSVCFANCEEIWELMCKMDLKYVRSPELFKNHPILQPQMRAILIDWIMDVCEAYKLHRETLYLAIDYLDRYLAIRKNLPKAHLQLIGITCLFVAAKLEEVYPPKLKTFAYVTDGACSEAEILEMELALMKTLKWKLTPITPATWINIYLQILAYQRKGTLHCTRSGADFLRSAIRDIRDKPADEKLIKLKYDKVDYVRVIRLVDLAILDSQSLNFTYSTLSAAAIYHIIGGEQAKMASGFSWDQLAKCVHWMAPTATVIRKHDIPPVLPSIEEVSEEHRHLVQSHCISLDMLVSLSHMPVYSSILLHKVAFFANLRERQMQIESLTQRARAIAISY